MNSTFSEQIMALACRFTILEDSLKNTSKPHMFFQLLKHFLDTVESQDPNTFHYYIARVALNHLAKNISENEQALDMLARELVNACCALNEQLKIPPIFAKLLQQKPVLSKKPLDPYIAIIELPKALDALDGLFFTNSQLSLWDNAYIRFLENTGPSGKKRSRELLHKFANGST